MEHVIRTDMAREIAEIMEQLPDWKAEIVLLFVRGLNRNNDEPRNVQEGGDSSAER